LGLCKGFVFWDVFEFFLKSADALVAFLKLEEFRDFLKQVIPMMAQFGASRQ
jgi:hypothetical protein